MKKLLAALAVALISLSSAAVSLADGQVLVTKGSAKKPSFKGERLINETATDGCLPGPRTY